MWLQFSFSRIYCRVVLQRNIAAPSRATQTPRVRGHRLFCYRSLLFFNVRCRGHRHPTGRALDSIGLIFTQRDTFVWWWSSTTSERTHGTDGNADAFAPPHRGMLFLYPTLNRRGRVLDVRTKIPLDIAFSESGGVIRNYHDETPCQSRLAAGCASYLPEARISSARGHSVSRQKG